MIEIDNQPKKESEKKLNIPLSLIIFLFSFILTYRNYLRDESLSVTFNYYSPLQNFGLAGVINLLFILFGIVIGYLEVFKIKQKPVVKLLSLLGFILNILFFLIIVVLIITIYQKIF